MKINLWIDQTITFKTQLFQNSKKKMRFCRIKRNL